MPFESRAGVRETPPTDVAVERLLDALVQLDQRPDGLRDLETHCTTAGRLAYVAGRDDLARVWVTLRQVVLAAAEDHAPPTRTGRSQ